MFFTWWSLRDNKYGETRWFVAKEGIVWFIRYWRQHYLWPKAVTLMIWKVFCTMDRIRKETLHIQSFYVQSLLEEFSWLYMLIIILVLLKEIYYFMITEMKLRAYSDADLTLKRSTTSRYCVFLGGNLVSRKSEKQQISLKCCAKSEYIAMAAWMVQTFINRVGISKLSVYDSLVWE